MPFLSQIRAAAEKAASQNIAPLYGGDGRFVVPLTPLRALYNEALIKYADAKNDLAIEVGTIVSEVVLSITQGTQIINFQIRKDVPNLSAIRSTENRLDIADGFLVHEVGLFVGDELRTSVAPGTCMYQQFPNSGAVSAAATAPGGFGANTPGIREIYNGAMSAVINSVAYLDALSCETFIYAAQSQANTLVFTASNTAWSSQEESKGFKLFVPSLDIHGNDKVLFSVQLPDAFTFSAEATTRVVARLVLRGLKVQGAGA